MQNLEKLRSGSFQQHDTVFYRKPKLCFEISLYLAMSTFVSATSCGHDTKYDTLTMTWTWSLELDRVTHGDNVSHGGTLWDPPGLGLQNILKSN